MKPVLLINPNRSEQTTEAMLGIVRQHFKKAIGWTNALAPEMITDPDALAAAADQIAMANLPAARGVMVAAFGDPGVSSLAAKLDIPVVGIGAAAARVAGRHGACFAVVTTTPKLAPAIDALMLSQADGYLGCFLTDGEPQALAANPAALDAALIQSCEKAVVAGAERIIIGGGPLATAAVRIAKTVTVPLVQPLIAACEDLAARTKHQAPRGPDASRSAR